MAIKIKTNKKGKQQAYYFSNKAVRWMPLPLAEAEYKIASGEGWQVAEDSKFGE